MKYMLLIYGNEELWNSFPPEEFAKVVAETNALQQELRESGEFIGAWGVADQVNAKTVKLQDGVPVVTDGPYLEAKEYLGSFDIIDDLAILRSLGFTRRQARIAITWQATLLTIIGLVVGIPLGIVCGRLLWRWLADSFPVAYVPPLALVAMLVVVPIAIVLASVLAAPPAYAATRIRPAQALRTE